MVDGYVLIAISPDGEESFCSEYHFFDVRMEDLEVSNLEEELTPGGLSDCLVMVFFKYQSVRTGCWEYIEFEDCFIPLNHVVVKNNYKEFWREQVSIMVTCNGHKKYPDEDMAVEEVEWVNKIIEEWERFYNEEFKVHSEWIAKLEVEDTTNDDFILTE